MFHCNKLQMPDVEDIVAPKYVRSEVITCSRRTDVPAHYLDKYIAAFKAGFIDVPNPRNLRQVSRIDLRPGIVKVIVWWSKDFSKLIELYHREPEWFAKYSHMFHFTLNGMSTLEPGVRVSVDERLEQLQFLCETFGPESVTLRFDPITHWRDSKGNLCDNLFEFNYIVATAAKFCGIRSVSFSFCLPYSHAKRNMRRSGLTFESRRKTHCS